MKDRITEICYTSKVTQKTILAQDLLFINDNYFLNLILDSLSNFGRGGRYYNLDIVTQYISSKADNYYRIWEKIELKISNHLDLDLNLIETEDQGKEIYSQIYSYVIQILKQFMRALSRLLVKANLGRLATSYSNTFHFFLLIKDEELG